MTKVMIASYRTEAAKLLESLQRDGIIEILNAERAMVSKEWPELQVDITRPREMEEFVSRLAAGIDLLKRYETEKDGTSLFNPLLEVDNYQYSNAVGSKETVGLLEKTEEIAGEMAKCDSDIENAQNLLEKLGPWASMGGNVEDLHGLEKASCIVGVIPNQHVAAITEELAEIGAAIETVGSTATVKACVIACLNENASEVHKKLRAADFEAVNFEGIRGSIRDNISKAQQTIKDSQARLEELKAKAGELAKDKIKLQILFDHYQNLIEREVTRNNAPGTENVDIFEGWVKEKDYKKLEKIVSKFEASSISRMELADGEEPPVEIDNGKAVQPFEVVTRLYGMPNHVDIDPTVFLAPFFALFFGICLTDAAYGLVMIAFFAWLLRKMKGDKRFVWMMIACSVTTVVAGALTGGWCGDAIQKFFPALNGLRESLMWFDPMEKPMHFFAISLGLGYFQILFGIAVGFVHKLKRGDVTGALFDHGTWLVWLISLTVFGLAKAEMLPAKLGPVFGVIAIIPAVGIMLFSEREGTLGRKDRYGYL